MKVHVVVTDDKGNVFEGEAALVAISAGSRGQVSIFLSNLRMAPRARV